MGSSIGQNYTSSCQQLVVKSCHERLRFGWKTAWYLQQMYLEHYKSIIHLPLPLPPVFILEGMSNKVGLTFSVGDIVPWFIISIEQNT